MKKSLLITLSTLAFIFLFGLAIKPIFPHLPALWSTVLLAILQDGILLFLFLVLFLIFNRKFLKQKLLFEPYPYLKGFGILWLAWFYLIIALVSMFTKHYASLLILTAFIAFVLVGLTEEFIFRGLILGNLVRQGKSLPLAVSVSSLLFAMTHLINLTHQSLPNTLLQVAYVFPLGVFLGALYIKSNNFIYLVILHSLLDFNSVLLTGSANSTQATSGSVLLIYLIFGGVSAVYFAFGKKQSEKFKQLLKA